MKKNISGITLMFVVAILIIIVPACDKETKKVNLFTVQDDIDLGNQLAAEIAGNPNEFPILNRTTYDSAYSHLDRIIQTILNTGLVSYGDVFPWKAYIIDNDTLVNAFAVPGGHLYFYTGLIKALDNEAEFAAVMAHEIAHVARRHSTEQLTKAYGIQLLTSILLGENPSMLTQIAADIAGGLTALAFSRRHEYEADYYAIKYLSSTDYHPLALADFFSTLEGLPMPPTWLSTHPSPEDRIEKIEEAWVEHGSVIGDYFEQRYMEFINTLP